jgi:myosin heavy subunit
LTFKGDEDGGRTTLASNSIPIDKLSSFLGVGTMALTDAVTVRNVRSGRGSIMSMNLDESQSKQGVNALIKHIYGNLFAWLIEKSMYRMHRTPTPPLSPPRLSSASLTFSDLKS